jgi:hypothetical protein
LFKKHMWFFIYNWIKENNLLIFVPNWCPLGLIWESGEIPGQYPLL